MSLRLLTQLSNCLIEFCQGPVLLNQLKCIEANCVGVIPDVVWWLTRRQRTLVHASTVGMTEGRKEIRKERLKGFQDTEASLLHLLLSIIEGSTPEVMAKTVCALKKDFPANSIGRKSNHKNGISILIANMNMHAVEKLSERRGFTLDEKKTKIPMTQLDEQQALIGAPVLFQRSGDTTVNSISDYYILLSCLSEHDAEVRKMFAQWEQPDQFVLFNRRRSSSSSAGGDVFGLYTAEHVRAEIAGVIRQIEIQRDGQLETVYFPVPRTCAEQLESRFVPFLSSHP